MDTNDSCNVRFADYFPVQRKDKLAFSLMIVGVPFVFVWDLLVVAPTYYDSLFDLPAVIHFSAELFIIANIFGNMFMTIKTSKIGTKLPLVQKQKSGWRHCDECKMDFPPRSYHCEICKVCTIKRNHHCAYAGTCVSYFNLRYYVVSVLYFWIAAVYGSIYYFPFFVETFGASISFYTIIAMMVPHFALLGGYTTVHGFLALVFQLTIFFIFTLVTMLLYVHITAVMNGQTQYERKYKVQTYNRGWKMNLKEALGERWYLIWICPWISSPLPSIEEWLDAVESSESAKAQ